MEAPNVDPIDISDFTENEIAELEWRFLEYSLDDHPAEVTLVLTW